jgi:hypothetical protein
MPDPQAYAEALRQSFQALKAAAVKTPEAPREQNDNKPAGKLGRRKGA